MRRAPASVWALVGFGLIAFGASPILIRLAGDVPALALAAWRTSIVAVVLTPFALTASRGELLALSPRDVLALTGAGGLLGLHFMGWIVSVQLTSVASAAVLVTTSPIFVVLIGAVFLAQRPTKRLLIAIAVAVGGAAMIGLSKPTDGVYPDPALGDTLALGAAVVMAVYLLIGAVVRRRLGFVATFWAFNVVASATCLVGCWLADVPLGLSPPVIGLAVLMGLGPGLLGHGSFVAALRYLPATTLSTLSLAEPVIASVVALLWFQEMPTALAAVGMLIVLAAITIVVTERKSAGGSPASEPSVSGEV